MGHIYSQVQVKFNLLKMLLLSVIGWLLILILIPIFIVYRTFIHLVLKMKLGIKYGGLLNQEDAVFLIPDDNAKHCIITVLYIRSDKELDLFHMLRDSVQEKIFSNPEQYPKLTSSKHDFGGYPYWIRNGCQVDDVVRPLKIAENVDFNEEYLKKCAGEISNAELGKNGTILWEIHISEKPLKGDYDDNSYRYPVVFRCQHAVGDGTSLMAIFLRLYGDESAKNYSEELFNKLFKRVAEQTTQKTLMERINQYLSKFLKALLLYLEIFFIALGRVAQAILLQPHDMNALHATKYSGEKIAAWSNGNHVKCVPLIKNIKNRTNTKFTCVLNTAITASMTNYFKRNDKPIPDSTSGMITLLLDFPSMDESKPVRLDNKTTVCYFDLPCTHKSKNLVEALQRVQEVMSQQLKYSDAMVVRLLFSSNIGLIPLKLISGIAGMKSHTFLITNVPGGSQVTVLDGCILEKIVPIAPNVKGVGISFALLSYGDQLQVGVLVDKALTESQEDVQRIADDLIHSIKILDVESRKLYGDVS